MPESGMPKTRHGKAEDPRQLRIENELLTAEVRRLRHQLDELRTTAAGRWAEKELEETQDREAEAEALTDIRWLMQRLDTPPLGRLLRARPGFRALMEKYGTDAS